MHFPILSSALAALTLATALTAQIQVFTGETERKACTLIIADMKGGDFSPKGAVSINYTQPQWQDKYDAMLDKNEMKDSNQRLGKNWWTSFDTTIPLDIGGTKVAPGAYYLGIHIDLAGKFQLLVIDAKQAMTLGWAPFMPAPWKTDIKAPLTLAKGSLKESVELMEIEIAAEKTNPATGKFSIRWGKHELSAPVKFLFDAGAKDASGKKDEAKK